MGEGEAYFNKINMGTKRYLTGYSKYMWIILFSILLLLYMYVILLTINHNLTPLYSRH